MIRAWHLARGFSDIGYHYVILPDGTVEIGRPLWRAGSHCQGHNLDSVAICLVGLKAFGMPQFDALRPLLMKLKRDFPRATLHGHREFNPGKTCPVFDYTDLVRYWCQMNNKGELPNGSSV
jgi:N-acetyl-anhydromuramyl-L-alanine amidase AmpD